MMVVVGGVVNKVRFAQMEVIGYLINGVAVVAAMVVFQMVNMKLTTLHAQQCQ